MRRTPRAALWLFLCSPGALAAGEFSLQWPVACTRGQDCHIQNYVDRDPGPGVADVACGPLSYDGHKGTDIALPSLDAMRRGVPVIAAAPGVVLGTRDGMRDISARAVPAEEIENRECGNGLIIEHDGGWQSQYCHLRQGSVAVQSGERVAVGQFLGLVGLSGRTEFPHLHLSLRRDGKVVDPFEPGGDPDCGITGEGLWAEAVDYVAGGALRAGFSDAVPDYEDLKARDLHRADLPSTAPALVFWGYFWGGRKGDVVEITIDGPAGRFHETRMVLGRDQAQFFRASGRRRPEGGLARGPYHGGIVLLRDGEEIARLMRETVVE